jgi:hypothetical protein
MKILLVASLCKSALRLLLVALIYKSALRLLLVALLKCEKRVLFWYLQVQICQQQAAA